MPARCSEELGNNGRQGQECDTGEMRMVGLLLLLLLLLDGLQWIGNFHTHCWVMVRERLEVQVL